MRRQLSSIALVVCGIMALVGGLTMMLSPVAVAAQAPQPSPRPTLQPTPDLRHRAEGPTAVPLGRLTGTVIDLRTGAPTSGITVLVGSQAVSSDANGNYDIWLSSGYYRLELKLTSNQGTATQPAQAIAIGPGDTVVVHLFFTSPAPTAETQQIAPPALEPTPTTAPPVAMPPNLPDTSVAHGAAAHPLADSLSAPESLPHTAAAAGLGAAGTWILFGALLLGLGLVVQLAPRPRQRHSLPPRRTRPAAPRHDDSDEGVLADLLNRDLCAITS